MQVKVYKSLAINVKYRKDVFTSNYISCSFSGFRLLRADKVVNTIKAQEYYEKPTRWRRRFMYERCKRIYDSEMSRKINFISRTHRADPWPR